MSKFTITMTVKKLSFFEKNIINIHQNSKQLLSSISFVHVDIDYIQMIPTSRRKNITLLAKILLF